MCTIHQTIEKESDVFYRVAETHRMPKLQVSFGLRASNYRALLWKMTYKDKVSYGSPPPCAHISMVSCILRAFQ